MLDARSEPISDAVLEAGIAALVADLPNRDPATGDDPDAAEAALEEDITFTLLSELNRLWDRPAA